MKRRHPPLVFLNHDLSTVRRGTTSYQPGRVSRPGYYIAHTADGGEIEIKAGSARRARSMAGRAYGKGYIRSVLPAYRVELVPVPVEGTGIPIPTLKRIREGTAKPSPATKAKLRAFNERMKYAQMREAGIAPAEARKRRTHASYRVENYIENHQKNVKRIAKMKGVDPLYIAYGLSISHQAPAVWDFYADDSETDLEPIDDDIIDQFISDFGEVE